MKKIIFSILSIFLLNSLVFSNDTETVVLNVLDYQDPSSPNAYYDNINIWDAFEDSHPNITINRESYYEYDFYDVTNKYIANEIMPDVFYMWPTSRSEKIHKYNLAKDLTPFLERDGLLDKYIPILMDGKNQFSGYIAELPTTIMVSNCVYVNNKVLEDCGLEPATTYEELKAQVPILDEYGYDCVLMGNSDNWVAQSCLVSMVLGRLCGPNWANDIINGDAKFTDEPFLNAIKTVKQMQLDGIISEESLNTDYQDVTFDFAYENGAYLIDGDWRVGAFLSDWNYGALIDYFDQEDYIELMNFPALPDEVLTNSNSVVVGPGYGMSASIEEGSAKEEAAWELIKWLASPEIQQYRMNSGVVPSLREDIDYSQQEPLVEKRANFYDTISEATPVFDNVFDAETSETFNNGLQLLFWDNITPEELCELVQKTFDNVR